MLDISSTEDIAVLSESVDVECKLAQRKDGKGALPKDFWPTYSAFANTEGGDIFLGIKETKPQVFELAGISNVQKVKDDLWTCLNNPEHVSKNILRERNISVIELEGRRLIHVRVPRASRRQAPVYIKNNPLKGTYKRLNSADVRMDDESVRRLLAEQVEDSRDNEVLKGYGLDDLDHNSLAAYRNMYISLNPDHLWNQVDAQDFLNNIGAWRKDREAGHSGLTRAGLLMFGRLPAIQEAFPNFMLDYQERPEANIESRWIDRLTLDGSWSGNLFDFYSRVIRKLVADLKVPFIMEGDQRQDDTPIHKALREALVNTLVHADYSGRASVLVVKRPDMFGFRNPGLMRVPLETAIKGGESDCRNRLLHQMFRYIGLGEQAGSGLPKIYQGWKEQHWRQPSLTEKREPSEQTQLEMHTLSLVPEQVLQSLRMELGEQRFDRLSEDERLILVTAQVETTVNHARMMDIMHIHPKDLTALFSSMLEKNLIKQGGTGRGTVYFLAGASTESALLTNFEQELYTAESSGGLAASSGGLSASSGGLDASSGGLNAKLHELAEPVSSKKKAPKPLVEETILGLCALQALSLSQISELLNRSESVVRKDYLRPLLAAKKLRYRYPTSPQHPEQAYITENDQA